MPETAFSPRQALAALVKSRDVVLIFTGMMAVFVPLIIPLPPLAMDLLEGGLREGDTVQVNVGCDGLTFHRLGTTPEESVENAEVEVVEAEIVE